MLYRFQIELSDIDRGVYKSLDFRVALHPSETLIYLLCRVLAYCLSYEENLEFSAEGLSDPEAPALKKLGLHSAIDLWIEIGSPSARKLHKATKLAKQVRVFTYKNPEVLKAEISSNAVYRADTIEIVSLPSSLLEPLTQKIEKFNRWNVLVQQGQVDITIGEDNFSLPGPLSGR